MGTVAVDAQKRVGRRGGREGSTSAASASAGACDARCCGRSTCCMLHSAHTVFRGFVKRSTPVCTSSPLLKRPAIVSVRPITPCASPNTTAQKKHDVGLSKQWTAQISREEGVAPQ